MKPMWLRVAFATAFGWLACTSSAFAANVTLQIHDGRVTLDARDVPVVEILAEWSRVGQTTIVGGEKTVASPVTIQMVDVPESAALDVILKQCAGYAAARWPVVSAGGSIFQRILILAASTAPATADRALPVPSSPLTVAPPVAPPVVRRTALPPIDVTPPVLPGPAFESDTPAVSGAAPSFATPWVPAQTLSPVPGIVAPSAQNPTVARPPGPPRIR
jgi:hypothetical protein